MENFRTKFSLCMGSRNVHVQHTTAFVKCFLLSNWFIKIFLLLVVHFWIVLISSGNMLGNVMVLLSAILTSDQSDDTLGGQFQLQNLQCTMEMLPGSRWSFITFLKNSWDFMTCNYLAWSLQYADYHMFELYQCLWCLPTSQ